jgi:hypothetical protein
MVEFRPLLISFILIGLFAVAMMNAVYYMQIDNDANETIMDSQYGLDIYKQNVTDKLEDTYTDSVGADNSTSSSQVTFNFGSPFLDAINGVWKTIKVAPITVYQLTIGMANKMFFSGPEGLIITTTIGAILTITIVFAVWKMISTGDSG